MGFDASYWGTLLRSSDDFGKSWTNPQQAPIRFPSDTGVSLKNIWQIALGRPEEPNVLYCGVEPAALFETRDAGETWSLVRGLFDHPHRPRWVPGNGGLALHTIVLDPADNQRMYVAISAGGVYRTNDGGTYLDRAKPGHPRHHSCPTNIPSSDNACTKSRCIPTRPERLFLQNHWGLYRSDNGAENWTDIANGVPSDFGFAMVMHPRNPDCVYIVPVESDEFRCACDGRLRVYRTRNGGASWEPLMRGLPQKRAYETVLRDAMTADSFDPAGIYFGTRSGQLFGSRDEGRTWQKILEGLPSVVCVRSAVVEDASGGFAPTLPKAAPAPSHRNEISVEKQDTSNEEMIHAGHFSHSGSVARIYCWTRVESRSSTHPQLWPTRCRLFGHSIRAFEIALQRSKDKCGNISIFSLATKIFDIPADSRVALPAGS